MFRRLRLFVSLVLLAAPLSAAPWVKVDTTLGEFVIELYPERAPLTVANFLSYVQSGHYTDTLVHRIVGNFVIQGGGYLAGNPQPKATKADIPNESGNGLKNLRGAVGLARSESPHSGNAQIYINLADNPDLDPVPTRWGYAVFGKVVGGMTVVERMGVLPTGAVGPFKSDSPIQPVVLKKMTVLERYTPP